MKVWRLMITLAVVVLLTTTSAFVGVQPGFINRIMQPKKPNIALVDDSRTGALDTAVPPRNDNEWMFFDVARINLKSGDGGDGCMAMRREYMRPMGGPSGGNGGRGGSIYLECDSSMNTLSILRRKVHYKAGSGQHGRGDSRHGHDAEDVVIKVPPGTVVSRTKALDYQKLQQQQLEHEQDVENIPWKDEGDGGFTLSISSNSESSSNSGRSVSTSTIGATGTNEATPSGSDGSTEMMSAIESSSATKENASSSSSSSVSLPGSQSLGELMRHGQRLLVAVGGVGGRGNEHFKTARHNAPAFAEVGQKGQEWVLHLELKLLADVGLVGVPNAGKSSLLAACSNARPKIASYPFTTVVPNLGVCDVDKIGTYTPSSSSSSSSYSMSNGANSSPQSLSSSYINSNTNSYSASSSGSFVLADIPGLLTGAHSGVGMGLAFLRHIQRCRVLIHVLDGESEDITRDFLATNNELQLFNEELLSGKTQVVVVNKIDLPDVRENLSATVEKLKKLSGHNRILGISAVTGERVRELMQRVNNMLVPPTIQQPLEKQLGSSSSSTDTTQRKSNSNSNRTHYSDHRNSDINTRGDVSVSTSSRSRRNDMETAIEGDPLWPVPQSSLRDVNSAGAEGGGATDACLDTSSSSSSTADQQLNRHFPSSSSSSPRHHSSRSRATTKGTSRNNEGGHTDESDLGFSIEELSTVQHSHDTARQRHFRVSGHVVDKAVQMTNWKFHEGVERLMRVLEAEGVTQTLKGTEYGAKQGDLVTIGEWDFVF